jgi:hypothetical protein
MDLVWPAPRYLSGYADALRRGWSSDNLRVQTALDELERIEKNPDRVLCMKTCLGPRETS